MPQVQTDMFTTARVRHALLVGCLFAVGALRVDALGPPLVTVLGAEADGAILVLTAACPGATQVRLAERPNLVQRDWQALATVRTQRYAWLGPAGTGTLYCFFRDSAGDVARTSIVVVVTNAVVDRVFSALYRFFTDPSSHHNYLPYTYAGSLICNTTEIGLWALSHMLAYDQQRAWSPTWPAARQNIEGTLTVLLEWMHTNKVYQGQAYYQFYQSVNQSIVNYSVPSIDNALLDACLLMIRGYCAQRPFLEGTATLTNLCAQLLKPKNYSLWYSSYYHRFGWLPESPASCDYYSGENRLINFMARTLALEYGTWNFTSNEFAVTLRSPYLLQPTVSYDGIAVPKCCWDGSLFTYLFPAQFYDEQQMVYGSNTMDRAIAAQIDYMHNNGRFAFGISDGPPPPGIQYQMGCPPRASNNSNSDPDTGCVNPGALSMCMNSAYRPETIAALHYLLTNKPAAFSDTLGFRGTISVIADAMSAVHSELDNGHAIMAYANACNETGWNAFYANPAVARVHQEITGAASGPADFAPPVVGLWPTGGYYNAALAVQVCADDTGGSGVSGIWYTTAGSDPWTSTARVSYIAPFVLYTDAVVRMVATDNAGNESVEYQAVYTIVPEGVGMGMLMALMLTMARRQCA